MREATARLSAFMRKAEPFRNAHSVADERCLHDDHDAAAAAAAAAMLTMMLVAHVDRDTNGWFGGWVGGWVDGWVAKATMRWNGTELLNHCTAQSQTNATAALDCYPPTAACH